MTDETKDGMTGGVLSLLDSLKKLTKADLDELDAKIEAGKEHVANLQQLRSLVAGQLGVQPARGRGRPAKASPKPAAAATPGVDEHHFRRLKVARLLNTRSPLMSGAIMRECDIGPTHIKDVLFHKWFEGGERGYTLTAAGRAEALRAAA